MKILPPFSKTARRRERGSAIIVVMMLLALVLAFAGANVRALSNLGRELKLIDQRQVHRWSSTAIVRPPSQPPTSPSTNSPAAEAPPAQSAG